MSADISTLTNLQAGEPLEWDQYKDAQEASAPPPRGRYVVRAPDKFTFSATQQGYLSAQVDPVIAGGPHAGYAIKYSRVSAKPFKRGGVTVSQLGDYLRAAGVAARPKTPQEMADAVEQTAGRTFEIDLDWEAYDKVTQARVEGMDSFPPDGNGGRQPWVRSTSVAEGDTEPKILRANARITRFIPAAA